MTARQVNSRRCVVCAAMNGSITGAADAAERAAGVSGRGESVVDIGDDGSGARAKGAHLPVPLPRPAGRESRRQLPDNAAGFPDASRKYQG